MRSQIVSVILATTYFFAGAENARTLTSDNYATEVFKGVFIEMPDYRTINSGTKLRVTYEDDCPMELIGAFEHAVKIWEEVLPVALPINVTVKLGAIRGSGNTLSRVTLNTYEFSESPVHLVASPLSLIKSVVLKEYNAGHQNSYISEMEDASLFDKTDFTITYNKSMLNQISFSLDIDRNEDKYDFITMALRDIAIGLGFTSNFTADTTTKQINFTGEKEIPFQHHITETHKLWEDPHVAYTTATQGSLDLSGFGYKLSLYAPDNWINGVSLRYFIPEDHPLSKLLTYDFGKGYYMRDLSGVDWNQQFRNLLDWDANLTSGMGNGSNNSVSQSGNSTDKLPYSGSVDISFSSKGKSIGIDNSEISISQDIIEKGNGKNIAKTIQEKTLAIHPVTDYCKKYDSYAPNGRTFWGIAVSVLMKDGSWDCIYDEEIFPLYSVTINMDDLHLNYADTCYARGTTGGLRYRVSFCGPGQSSDSHGTIVKYFTRDYTPQKAFIKYSKELNTSSNINSALRYDDDYFVDVKVGISNVEGVTKMTVEQLDEGEILPFTYDVTDFRKGYFIANCDRELSTTLTVISYNEYGYKRSNTITIPPLGFSTREISFSRRGDILTINGIPEGILRKNRASYEIYNIANQNVFSTSAVLSDGHIDLSEIPQGVYAVTVRIDSEITGTYKMIK